MHSHVAIVAFATIALCIDNALLYYGSNRENNNNPMGKMNYMSLIMFQNQSPFNFKT